MLICAISKTPKLQNYNNSNNNSNNNTSYTFQPIDIVAWSDQ